MDLFLFVGSHMHCHNQHYSSDCVIETLKKRIWAHLCQVKMSLPVERAHVKHNYIYKWWLINMETHVPWRIWWMKSCMWHPQNVKNHTYKWCIAYFKVDRPVKKHLFASQMSGNLDGLFSLCILGSYFVKLCTSINLQ